MPEWSGGTVPNPLNLGTGWRWVVSTALQPALSPGERPRVVTVQEAGWAPELLLDPVIRQKSFLCWWSNPGIVRKQILHWLSYPDHVRKCTLSKVALLSEIRHARLHQFTTIPRLTLGVHQGNWKLQPISTAALLLHGNWVKQVLQHGAVARLIIPTATGRRLETQLASNSAVSVSCELSSHTVVWLTE
jgi:hypothetical protein